MATVLSKTFDAQHGAVVVQVQDAVLKNTSIHTIYVLPPNGVADVDAAIAQICTQADTDAQAVHDRLVAAGWVPSGN